MVHLVDMNNLDDVYDMVFVFIKYASMALDLITMHLILL